MKRFLIVLIFLGGLAGCSQPANDPQFTIADLQQQLAAIQNFIDSGKCTDSSTCSYIAYGSKACGGPQGYLVFSNTVDVEALKQMVREYTEAEAAYNKRTGAASDCSLAQPPQEVGCESGKCVKIE